VRLELHFDILFRWLPERTAVPWVRRLVISLSPRGPRFFPGQCMWHLWWTERQWDKLFPEYLGFALKYYFTNGPYSSSFTFCCFQKDERAKPGKYSSRPPPPPPQKKKSSVVINRGALARKLHSLFQQRADSFTRHAMLQYNQDSACPQTQKVRSWAPAGFDTKTDILTASNKLTWTSGLK